MLAVREQLAYPIVSPHSTLQDRTKQMRRPHMLYLQVLFEFTEIRTRDNLMDFERFWHTTSGAARHITKRQFGAASVHEHCLVKCLLVCLSWFASERLRTPWAALSRGNVAAWETRMRGL